MPVILATPQDPTDIVLQGEQLHVPLETYRWESNWSPLLNDVPDRLPLTPNTFIPGLQNMTMLDRSSIPSSTRAADQSVNNGIRANACVCTPCGAVIPVLLGHQWFWNDIGQTTARFSLIGVTRDATGAPLGNCRVVVYESGRIYVGGNECRVGYATDSPVVGETISDGSGNYTLLVPLNTAYQAMGYKAGSPDVFGTTLNTLTPSQG